MTYSDSALINANKYFAEFMQELETLRETPDADVELAQEVVSVDDLKAIDDFLQNEDNVEVLERVLFLLELGVLSRRWTDTISARNHMKRYLIEEFAFPEPLIDYIYLIIYG